MTFTERYVHTGQIALNVAEWPAPSPDSQVMMLIHGYGSNWHTWGRVVDKLSTEFHLFALDLRAMGRSGRLGQSSERQTWADDITAALPMLGDKPAILAGHSFGGWVAAAVASQHPELVSGVILVDPYSGSHSEVGKQERQQRHEERMERANLIRTAQTPDDLIPMVTARYAGASEGSIGYITRMYFEMDPALEEVRMDPSKDVDMFEDMFRAIQCPTLLIQGNVEKGGIMSDEEAARVIGLIANSRLLSWPKVGHSPHIARNHDFIRAAKRFAAE
ncbi:MAG TPA: alpha/beta hydrolase [Dehalococcoidia bacterium]|jgi:pimeloyl-ACP methyl ester carboxylesterase|nr:alpha/beta hydrolase [Dehalococcoidia bacterium]HIK88208.1 alpha/beta hydrolase [Dehalococcoidia bacterium]